MDIITTAINNYNNIFAGYLNQFLEWGEELFYTCSIIAIVWLCLWRAFDHESFHTAMASFIKEFFVVAFFYTVMINAGPWLSSIVSTVSSMSLTLVNQKVDPASIITQGFAIANSLLVVVNKTSFLTNQFGALVVGASYGIILFAFFAVGLDLAITIIFNSILISVASMFLALAVFPITRSAARKTLDLVIANNIKLLIMYVVIAAGSGLISQIGSFIPTDKITSFDIFGWLVVSCLLFWSIAKYIPKSIAKIFTDMLQEARSSNGYIASPSYTSATDISGGEIAKINVAEVMLENNNKMASSTNSNLKTQNDSAYNNLSDHFKNIADKIKR